MPVCSVFDCCRFQVGWSWTAATVSRLFNKTAPLLQFGGSVFPGITSCSVGMFGFCIVYLSLFQFSWCAFQLQLRNLAFCYFVIFVNLFSFCFFNSCMCFFSSWVTANWGLILFNNFQSLAEFN